MTVQINTIPLPKTYPTKSAGPFYPILPLQQPLLRLIPGYPRDAIPPLADTSSLGHAFTLQFRSGDSETSIQLPTTQPIPTQWADFPLQALSTVPLTISLHATTSTLSLATTTLNPSDFDPRVDILRVILNDDAGIPISTLTLNYTVITPIPTPPFPRQPMSIPRLTGHRGMGASSGPNGDPRRPLENSPLSFLLTTLPSSAVSTVELDVQPTRDGRTVIYHDWHFHSEGQPPRPIYSMSFDEFDAAYRAEFAARDNARLTAHPRLAQLLKNHPEVSHADLDVKVHSLDCLCRMLPEEVGMLVELKYPSLNVQQDQVVPYPEMNQFIDKVLRDIFAQPKNRNRRISFLCFHADICVMLVMKQNVYPVYFSHCEGLDKPCDESDPRCIDVEEGMRFILSQRLHGVMLANFIVLRKPHAIEKIVKEGLPIITYGKSNSQAECVRKQFSMGVSGVIADDVHDLLDGLKES